MRNVVFIDFETYYDSKTFTLKKMSMLEYIRDPRFKVFGCAVKIGAGPTRWMNGAEFKDFAARLEWSRYDVCAQNVKFDGAILKWIYGISPRSYIDTLSMSRAVLGCRLSSHSLASIAAHYGLAPKGFMPTDGLLELTPEIEKQLAEYCIHDVDLCAEIYRRLSADFPEGQYSVMDWTLRCFIEPGFTLDGVKLKVAYEAEKVRREKIFTEIGIDKKVFSSNIQFPKLLQERGFEAPVKRSPKQKNADGTPKEIPALAVGDVQFLEMRNSGNPELEALCEARIAAKSNLLETRSLKFLEVSKLGLFPFDLNYSGAVNTHRFSGASGAGGNPQNLTRGSVLREAVCAPVGSALLVSDFNAIEARIVAWIAREPKLVELFSTGGDPYCAFATEVYRRPITKADKKERQFGKTCILGLGYGMGPGKFKYKVRLDTGMVISDEEALRVVMLYRNTYARIPGLWDMLNRYIPYIASGARVKLPGIAFLEIRDHCVYLPSGLRLQYPNLRQEKIGKYDEWVFDAKGEKSKLYGGKLLENISQALAGELCKWAIEQATAAGVNCKGQVHDEVLAISKTPETDLPKLVGAMETPPSWWPTLVLKSEGGAGPNWLKAKV